MFMNVIKQIRFIKSSPDPESCPKSVYPEYAFIGRSNVGKSSLLNMLTGKKNMAKTSGTPGKTKLINHFLINNEWYLVDLPGYGYLKSPEKARDRIMALITRYILKRKNLACLFILIDCRHEPQAIDLQFMEWVGINKIPFVLCFTKTDKISAYALEKKLANYKSILLKSWLVLPEIFVTSSLKKAGRDEILDFIVRTNSNVEI
jgi:GTP-binding protein